MAHDLIPAQVWLDYIGVFFKPKTTYTVFLSGIYFASDTEMINTRNDKFGEMNSQTFLFNFNVGYLIPKTPLSWGFTAKILTGRSFIYDRTLFGVDAGLMAVFPSIKMKTFFCVKNLGVDAIDIAKVINNAGPVEQRSSEISNAFAVQWPLSINAGFQYQLLKLFEAFFDLDFYPGKLTDAYFVPHVGLSFVGLPDFKFNAGWVFRNEAGGNFPSFGIEWNIRLSGLPTFGVQYAFEPIPGFAENHYFGLTMRFQ